MNFIRKRTKKPNKLWLSECRQYRIIYRREVEGIAVSPSYSACVVAVRSMTDRARLWDFAYLRRSYKTLKKAQEACAKNKALWDKIVALGTLTNNVRKLETLAEQFRHKTLPLWVLKKCHPSIVEALFPSLS